MTRSAEIATYAGRQTERSGARDARRPQPRGSSRPTACHVIDALNELGVEYLFCNFGTDHAPIIEELARRHAAQERAPAVILCPHENVAVHMAAGYAYSTGKGQVVFVHVDAGTANAAMGLHNLQYFRLPVFVIAGRAPFSSYGELIGGRNSYVNFVQEPFDQGSLVRPYVKWEYHLVSGITAKEALERGHQRMQADPQGPVYLTAARETLAETCDTTYEVASRPVAKPNHGDPQAIEEIVHRLLAARNPLLITSYAGRNPEAVVLLEALAHMAGIRIVEHNPHTVNLPHESACHGGFSPTQFISNTDLGILLDVDVPWIPSIARHTASSWWCHIDSDIDKATFPMWPFPADIRIQGPAAIILKQLIERLRHVQDDEFQQRAAARMAILSAERAQRARMAAEIAADQGCSGALGTPYVCAALARLLRPQDVVLNEAVCNAGTVFEHIPRSLPGTRVGPAGGGLGYSGGMALGIKLSRPDVTVVHVVGDGTFYFGNPLATLSVAVREHLPVLTVVLDNGGWKAVKTATERVYPDGQAHRTGMWQAGLNTTMDFAMAARAAGAYGQRVTEPAQLDAALEACLASVHAGKAAVLHVSIPPL